MPQREAIRRLRRTALTVIAALIAAAALAPAAEATFHLQKVNEVMLAAPSGGAAVQFVELFDKGGSTEVFPATFAPYRLVIYDAAGNRLGAHTLSAMGMASASAAGRPYLISTAAADMALGVSGDERLEVTLPAAGGQACYTIRTSEVAYSCITWGCITHAVDASSGTGSAHGAVPPSGQSAQRQGDDSIQIATPTPKAANRSGAATPACAASSGSGAGSGQPGTGGAFAGVTDAAHRLRLKRHRRIVVPVSCPAGSGGCDGKLALTARLRRGGRLAQLASTAFALNAGASRSLKLVLRRAVRHKLGRRRRIEVRLTISARDGGGTLKVTTQTLVLELR